MKKTYSLANTPAVTWCYDGKTYSDATGTCAGSTVSGEIGNLTAVGNSVAATEYGHDALGRVTRSVQKLGEISYVFGDPSDANVDGYEYNLAGGLTKMIYPSGRAVSYTHDGAGQPTSASGTMGSATKTYVGSVSYHPHGATNVMTLGNAAVETRLYNNRLQPTTVKLEKDAATLLSITNGYGTTSNNGNVLSQTIARSGGSVMHNFGYDGLNRLQTATQPGVWSQNYSYDRYGNRTASGILPSPTPASFSSTTNRITDSGYGFDPAGNLTATPGGRTLAYDAENRQTSLTDSGTTFTYHYDGEGRRVKKVTNLGATVYVYDAFGELAAEYADHAPVGQPECTTCYLTADHLGSTRVVTDGAGAVVEETDYYPFGEEISGGDWFNPKFTGQVRDYESGLNLDYFGARYLSGAMGRFTSPDPITFKLNRLISPQRWNLYSYVLNNPLKNIDPDGRDAMGVVYPKYRAGHEIAGRSVRIPTGHGATIIVDSQGRTRYYEYGRYESNRGETHRRTIPDLKLDTNGQPTLPSMEALFDKISQIYGQEGPIEAVLIPTDDAEDLAMQQYLDSRERQNSDSNRAEYTIWGHNCGTLVCDALGKTTQSTMTNPYGTPSGVLRRLWLLHLVKPNFYTYNPEKKKGQRVKVTTRIRYDLPEEEDN